ncbi:MAG TPA: methyltransferase domain-containing protein [Jiangellaceae bacterium]|nr:methyltransferase domain-containing protein [Jiangellaceae bacterium]
MAEWRLFQDGEIPIYTTPEWYLDRERAPHLEQDLHRGRLLQSARLVAEAAMAHRFRTVVDLGAGDGGLLSLLGPGLTGWGYDLCPSNVAAAKERGVDVRLGNVLDGPIQWGDIAVATEMLEHIVDPHGFVRTVFDNSRVLVASSPWNETPESHYEFHAWAWDTTGYRELMEQAGWVVRNHARVSMFQVLMAVKP